MPLPITVWAPRARRVDVLVDGEARPMRPASGGWYATELEAGTRYAFSLDGGPARPDPRSAYQPDGVHGPSEVFDARAFTFPDDAYAGVDALGAIFYELHVGAFTPEGTLRAAIDRLDYLTDLGVTMVELMPLAAFAGRHGWGYDGVAPYAVHEAYGGPAQLQEFVAAAHARGLGVCLDVVYNHLGPSGNYLAEFGPYFTDAHHTPWGAAVNLDGADCGPVREYFIDSALRWFTDFRIDALRLDAVHALIDDSRPHFLAELSDRTAALAGELGRPLSLIAESDLNDAAMVTPTARGGLGMDAQWNDDIHHALHAWLTGERHGYYADFGSGEALAKAFTRVFFHDGTYSSFRKRTWGAPVARDIDPRRFVSFTENHDQVGNRGLGDRPTDRMPLGVAAGGLALLLLSPYTPMLFMGQEFAASTPFPFFSDHEEPDLAEAIRAGRRREFAEHGWTELYGADAIVPDPQDPATFRSATLNWAEPESGAHRRMHAFVRDLLRLRAQAFTDPGTLDDVEPAYGEDWFVLRRAPLTVAVNRSASAQTLPGTGGTVLLSFADAEPVVTSDAATVAGHGVVVLGAAHE